MTRPLTRHLVALGATALLALPLSACGGKTSDSSSAGDTPTVSDSPSETPTDVSTPPVTEVPPAPPTETTSDAATPTPTEDTSTPAPDTSPASAGGRLVACDLVTPALLNADVGLHLTAPGMSQPSAFSDPNSTDCLFFADQTPIVVQATTRADMDAPASGYDVGSLPGAKSISGADRGYAYVLSSTASASVATTFVVVGQRALEVELSAAQTITVDQAVKLGEDLVTALKAS